MPQLPSLGRLRVNENIELSLAEEDMMRVKDHGHVITASLHGKGEADPSSVDWLRHCKMWSVHRDTGDARIEVGPRTAVFAPASYRQIHLPQWLRLRL
jgi:hypothetical protein